MQTFTTLRAAIRDANTVLIQPRFGLSERWLKISKKEALEMIRGYGAGIALELDERYSWIDDELYIG